MPPPENARTSSSSSELAGEDEFWKRYPAWRLTVFNGSLTGKCAHPLATKAMDKKAMASLGQHKPGNTRRRANPIRGSLASCVRRYFIGWESYIGAEPPTRRRDEPISPSHMDAFVLAGERICIAVQRSLEGAQLIACNGPEGLPLKMRRQIEIMLCSESLATSQVALFLIIRLLGVSSPNYLHPKAPCTTIVRLLQSTRVPAVPLPRGAIPSCKYVLLLFLALMGL